MKRMVKVVIVCSLAVLGAVACGEKKPAEAPPGATSAEATPAAETPPPAPATT